MKLLFQRAARFGLAGIATLGLLAAPAQAQDFPTKAVRIITPFPVGSGPEGVLRLLADKLSRTWGKPVTVENRPGGNGFIAIDAFKRGAPDGYDLIQLDKDKFAAFGYEPFPTTREQFGQFMQAESLRFADVIKKAKASLD